MICQTCGADTAPGLRYCKQCGANLSIGAESTPPRIPVGITIGFLLLVGIITVIGLVGPLASASDLTRSWFGPGHILVLAGIGAATVITIDAMLIWLLLKLIKIYHPPPQVAPAAPQPMREVAPRQLAVPYSELGSVTEHTTRNFDPTYRKPAAHE